MTSESIAAAAATWNERYSGEDYVFGREPNEYLRAQARVERGRTQHRRLVGMAVDARGGGNDGRATATVGSFGTLNATADITGPLSDTVAARLIVNSEKLNFVDDPEHLSLLLSRIASMRSRREFFNLAS